MRMIAIAWSIGLIAAVAACRGTSERQKGPAAQSQGESESGRPGIEIVYEIDLDVVIEGRATDVVRDIEVWMREEPLEGEVKVLPGPPGAVGVKLADPAKRPQVEARLKSDYGDTLIPGECGASEAPGTICVRISDHFAAAIRASALKAAVDTIRRRLETKKIEDAAVTERAGTIVVRLPPLDDEALAGARDLIARAGRLEYKVVDEGSAYMKMLFAHVGSTGRSGDPTDPGAIAAEIRADVEVWSLDGSRWSDYYLRASDRDVDLPAAEAKQRGCPVIRAGGAGEAVTCRLGGRQAIEQYLAELARKDSRFTIPADRVIGYELVRPASGSPTERPYWRTYYLQRHRVLSGTAIADARASTDPYTQRPIVLLDFDKHGARVFADLTERIVGKKLATIIDGRIYSAPIIASKIAGGRASITMGGGDPKRQQQDADELVTIFRTGALPAPLRESEVRRRP